MGGSYRDSGLGIRESGSGAGARQRYSRRWLLAAMEGPRPKPVPGRLTRSVLSAPALAPSADHRHLTADSRLPTDPRLPTADPRLKYLPKIAPEVLAGLFESRALPPLVEAQPLGPGEILF